MDKPTPADTPPPWAAELLRRVEQLAARVAELERAGAAGVALAAPAAAAVPPPATPPAAPPAAVTDEDMVFIAAAVAAFLGARARIRQVRLVQSSAWAQVGRATIHASHRVH